MEWIGPYWNGSEWITGEHPIVNNPITDEEKEDRYWDYSSLSRDDVYTSMLESIEYYKGFYIGRYEAGIGTDDKVESKRNISPIVGIAQTEAIKVCANKTKESINTHLMYGTEWDSVLNWLIGKAKISSDVIGELKTMKIEDIQTNSSSWGNYSNSTGDSKTDSNILQNTGTSEYWKVNNIYDLAGNVWEWTQEKYSTGNRRTSRGGGYNGDALKYPSAYRGSNDADYTDNHDVRISC